MKTNSTNINMPINNLICPHLGLINDPNTHSSYPSTINVCHRCHPNAIPSLSHQQEFCLSKNFKKCCVFNSPLGDSMPRNIRHKDRSINVRTISITLALLLFLALVILGIIFGFWKDLFNPNIVNTITKATSEFEYTQVTINDLSLNKPTNTLAATLPATQTPTNIITSTDIITNTSTPSVTPLPSITPSPIEISSPTITQTLTCMNDITLYGMSYVGDILLVSFNTPTDLDQFLIKDAFDRLTLNLDLPNFILKINGQEVTDHKIYLRDFDTTNILFIDLLADPGQVLEIQYSDGSGRYCSTPVTVPRPDQIGTPTPTTEPTRDRVTPTNTPSPTLEG
jgi:hypothetical protein